MNEEQIARFWSKVEKTDGCWLWRGALYGGGYAMVGKPPRRGNRVSWELAYGPIPKGMFVCHKCDVRHCVRPDHLFLGTHDDNMRDMWAKGRGSLKARKLSVQQVLEVRVRLAAGETMKSIGARFGVTDVTISHIKTGDCYRGVP